MLTKSNSLAAQDDTVTGVRAFDLQLFAGDPPPADPPAGDPPAAGAGDPPAGNPPPADPPAADPGKADPAAATGAPESYADFKVPEGLTYDAASAGDFLTVAKELNLTQDQAQKLVDLYGNRMLTMQNAPKAQSEAWYKESTKLYKTEELDLANKTLSRFADKEFIELLANTGLSNHPKMIGLFKSIGEQISEGKFIDATPPGSSGKPLYGNSPGMYK